MNFDLIAKDLVRKPPAANGATDPLDTLKHLEAAGFSPQDLFTEARQLYDSSEEAGVKRQILDMMIKIQGLYMKEEDKKDKPRFVFNFVGDATRINTMLCPPIPQDNI